MLTAQDREELRRIQDELRQPFPARAHELRDLPGGARKWAFIKWQTIRERLDDVYPDWIIDYSDIQYLGNDAICRCGITIMGIRKEALASVPISILSSKGNEMTRGSAADRLAAEGLKNSAELWGVGRYLDDQYFTIKLMWEGMGEFPDSMKGEIRKLSEQYKIDVKNGEKVVPVKPVSNSAFPNPKPSQKLAAKPIAIPVLPSEMTSQAHSQPLQNARVRAIRELFSYPKELAVDWLKNQGKPSFDDLSKESVDKFIGDICVGWAIQNGMNQFHAKKSYEKRVINTDLPEYDALVEWKTYVQTIKLEDKDLVEAPVS